MAVRAPRGGFGLNVRVMGRKIENRSAFKNIVADDIPGLMRAAASHHRPLHGEQFDHTWQFFLYRLFVTLMRQRIAGFKTRFRLPRPPFFHFKSYSKFDTY